MPYVYKRQWQDRFRIQFIKYLLKHEHVSIVSFEATQKVRHN